MKATFLSATVPLTKTFELENGELKKISHPRIIDVTSYEENFETVEELYEQIRNHAEKGHSFLKGNVTRPLESESRAGSTNSTAPTQILLLDFDGLREISDIEQPIKALGLSKIDRIDQFSSSMGIVPDRGLSAHVFMLLDRPWPPAMLKQWLISKNLSIPLFRNNLALTRTNNALRWGLDVTTCQNDKLIYIAPSIIGQDIKDSFKGERIRIVKKQLRTADLADSVTPSAEANRIEVEKVLNELRAKAGLPERKKVSFKTLHSVEYMTKPDQAVVTDVKTERGFTYLNINGGDSWAYYHPENNPDFIYNFKSEPVYKTSELLPDYWKERRKEIDIPKLDTEGKLYLAVRDFKTACYWNGVWNSKTKELEFQQARSKDQLIDYLTQYDQRVPAAIPDWNVIFDPQSNKVVDLETKTINRFVISPYLTGSHKKVLVVPSTIKQIIFNAVGSDEVVFEHFMNTLACIAQYRKKSETCWVFHGIEGTGKGMMLNHILKPIFGHSYVSPIRMRQLDSQFNDFMERCLILWIDEAKFATHKDSDIIIGDLKNYVTEPTIRIRKMYTPSYEARNYTTIIMVANEGSIIYIPPGTRRFNVGVYQTKKLENGEELVKNIPSELQNFTDYLFTRTADEEVARTALNNSARDLLINEGQTALDQATAALREGNLKFFEDLAPQMHLKPGASLGVARDIISGAYLALLSQIKAGKKQTLLREEIQLILEYVVGGIPTAPHKFTSLIKHHKLILKDGKNLEVKWQSEN